MNENENLIPVEKIAPFTKMVMSIGTLPSSFYSSMTYYESMVWLYEYIKNTVIPTVNNNAEAIEELQQAYITLKDYIDNYFENLDVQEEINKKLDQMAEEGYFDDLIIKYSIPKDVYRTKLYLSKIGRINDTYYLNNDYYGLQGGCYVGNNTYIYPLIKNDETGSARLFKVDFTTGAISSYNDVDGLYHANGCCENNGKLYFTQSYDMNNVRKNGIVEVDVATLEVEEIHNVDFNDMSINETITSIGYDKKYNKFYLITQNYFYICDDTFKVEDVISFKSPNAKAGIRQGGTFYDDYVCIVQNNENAIICYNRNGSLSHIIDIGQHQVGSFFGEIENVNIYEGELYINTALVHHKASNLYIVQFFKAKLNGGGLPQTLSSDTIFTNNMYYSIIVNKTTYNSLSDYNKFTSNGTYEKPFETIAEAIENLDTDRTYNILVTDTNSYLEVLDIYNKNCIIRCSGSSIGAMKLVQSKVTISNALFKHSISRSYSIGTGSYHTPLYVSLNSELWLTGSIGYDATQCSTDGMTQTCVVDGSTLHDGSSTSGSYQKFLAKYSSVSPLLTNAIVSTTNSINVKNNITHFSLYKDSSDTHTDTTLISLSGNPLYTNAYRGIWIAFNIAGLDTDYQKYDVNNTSRRIVVEDIDNNVRYGLKVTYTIATNEFRMTPFKFNTTSGEWERDTTTTWYAYYMGEI